MRHLLFLVKCALILALSGAPALAEQASQSGGDAGGGVSAPASGGGGSEGGETAPALSDGGDAAESVEAQAAGSEAEKAEAQKTAEDKQAAAKKEAEEKKKAEEKAEDTELASAAASAGELPETPGADAVEPGLGASGETGAEVDATGAMTFSVDFGLPEFRGLTPNLGLNYRSSRRAPRSWRDVSGMGWRLGGVLDIRRVSSSTAEKPVFTMEDRFAPFGRRLIYRCSDEDIEVKDSPGCDNGGTHTFKLETFQRLVAERREATAGEENGEITSWVLTSRSGVRSVFRPVGFWTSDAQPQKPTDETADDYQEKLDRWKLESDSRWLLAEQIDLSNNKVVYNYYVRGHWAGRTPQLTSISMQNRDGTEVFRSVLRYEARPDVFTFANGVNLTRVEERLSSVEVLARRSAGALAQRHATVLRYEQSSVVGRSLLAASQRIGSDYTIDNNVVTGGTRLPETKFEYASDFDGMSEGVIQGAKPDDRKREGLIDFAGRRGYGDFDGDGLRDEVWVTYRSTREEECGNSDQGCSNYVIEDNSVRYLFGRTNTATGKIDIKREGPELLSSDRRDWPLSNTYGREEIAILGGLTKSRRGKSDSENGDARVETINDRDFWFQGVKTDASGRRGPLKFDFKATWDGQKAANTVSMLRYYWSPAGGAASQNLPIDGLDGVQVFQDPIIFPVDINLDGREDFVFLSDSRQRGEGLKQFFQNRKINSLVGYDYSATRFGALHVLINEYDEQEKTTRFKAQPVDFPLTHPLSTWPSPWGQYVTGMVNGDFNGDGITDFILTLELLTRNQFDETGDPKLRQRTFVFYGTGSVDKPFTAYPDTSPLWVAVFCFCHHMIGYGRSYSRKNALNLSSFIV